MKNPCILIVEDDAQLRLFLRQTLIGMDCEVLMAGDAATGRKLLQEKRPDLLLLDLGLPDMDGARLIREVRPWYKAPIVVLSARISEQQKVFALDAGGDDFLNKPIGGEELKARVRAHLRRYVSPQGGSEFHFGDVTIRLDTRQVLKAGAEVHLSPHEFGILALLVREAGKVVPHRRILLEVWGPDNVDSNHYLRIYMGHLRHKLEAEPARPKLLLTEMGVGYRLMLPDPQA